NPEIRTAYQSIEAAAGQKLVSMVPEALTADFLGLFQEDESERELHELVKAADKLAAYLKCLAELTAGNQEFAQAEKELKVTVEALGLDEVNYFLATFVPSFKLTLDELA
ncbi:MAG TPA: 5'-deoxynucleotidase, partial [Pseudomonadales bacterium]|nr:5'-deoxynucleotidase [Pseudomonadales bacterium]